MKVYEYEEDEVAGTLSLIWEYDAEVHAATNGDVRRLGNGNMLHALGSAGQSHEVDASGNRVWLLSFGESLGGPRRVRRGPLRLRRALTFRTRFRRRAPFQ